MDFSKFKEKLSSFKDTTVKFYNKTLDDTAKKLANSSFTIKTLFDLEDFISKSKYYFNEASGKEEGKKIICIFASKDSEFFKDFLYELPLVYTKAWARNIQIKLVESSIEGLDLSRYSIKEIPSLVLFENEKVSKVVASEEKINKIVKSLSLDIEESIIKIDGNNKSGETKEETKNNTENQPQSNNNEVINDSDIIKSI